MPAMEAQKERARGASKFGVDQREAIRLSGKTDFLGYQSLSETAAVTSLIFDGSIVAALKAGQEGRVVLDHTPFYAESGGQVGDSGVLVAPNARFMVRDTPKNGVVVRAHWRAR